MACTGILSARRMPTCWSRMTFFLSPSPSPQSAAPLTAKANTRISWQGSLTAREDPDLIPDRFISSRLGQLPLEESLLGSGLPQCSVPIHVRRQPALKSFVVKYWAMNRVIVAHG